MLANEMDISLFAAAQLGCLNTHYKINTIDRTMRTYHLLVYRCSLLNYKRSNVKVDWN